MQLSAAYMGNPPTGDGGPTALEARLERVRQLLGIEGALLALAGGETMQVLWHAGASAEIEGELAGLHRRAGLRATPLIVPDIAAEGSPGFVRFYAGIPLTLGEDSPNLLLSLFDTRPRGPAMADQLAALAQEVFGGDALQRAQATIARLEAELAERERVVADLLATRRRQMQLVDRASETARIGIWECDLSDNSLSWSNGVYDLFEFPRGAKISREETLRCYSDASREAMERARAKAIAECSDFALDAEITTVLGRRRWMRLTGTVEAENGVAVRIFGMKQDITEEKLLADRTRYLAEFDVMTGLANRSQFQARLADLDGGGGHPPIGALLLVDLDNFKQINDTYGHALGDECLKEAASRLRDACLGAELVARIGGDEFAVLLGHEASQTHIDEVAEQIVLEISRPFMRLGQSLALSASVGIARADGAPAPDLFKRADTALYAAKAAGRNTSRTFHTGMPYTVN
jgi:diguanylate cyclase (GGDEF)-like protein